MRCDAKRRDEYSVMRDGWETKKLVIGNCMQINKYGCGIFRVELRLRERSSRFMTWRMLEYGGCVGRDGKMAWYGVLFARLIYARAIVFLGPKTT